MPEYSTEMILTATGGRLVGGPGPPVAHGISTDTRTLQPGALFVALKGESFDGHHFVKEAFSRGAAAALVARELSAPGPLIVVGDPLAALGALAKAHRSSLAVKVVAITGSTGKTTTKEMVAAILSQGWLTARTPGNFNNEIGVPIALLELESSHQAVVVELAMRGRGQIAYLAEMALPHIGVITNVGFSHMELLGSREGIAEAKAELLAALPAEGTAVLNAEDDFFAFLKSRSLARVVSFGQRAGADVQVEQVDVGPEGRVRARLRGWWGEEEIRLQAAGRHQALNAAAAAAAAMAAGANREWVAAGLSAFHAADMRSEIVEAPGGYTVINDCYNAAPDSMRVALELLADLPGGRRLAILGDMKELGPLTADWHREVGRVVADMPIAVLVTVGELGHYIAEGARRGESSVEVIEAPDNVSAAESARAGIRAHDVVLVKGSRAMKMEEIVASLLGDAAKPNNG